jgi:hypothetical protein
MAGSFLGALGFMKAARLGCRDGVATLVKGRQVAMCRAVLCIAHAPGRYIDTGVCRFVL